MIQTTAGNSMLTERDLATIGKDLLDSDPDRGVALLSADRRVLYANTAAGNMLRDGTPRGNDGLLPASVDLWLERFVERMRTQRGPASADIYYPDEADCRLRISVESTVREHVPHLVLRVQSQIPWAEPTVRRLQPRFGLTLREAQVAAGVARGYTNAEVAGKLGIVEKTVKNVLMSVFTKCRVRNRVELALRAFDAPIPDLDRRRGS
ncbi:MAG: helix-turn-helix transcriptional regulator [Planctomycetota bacterium]|nr:helix-turn-helix transcriptional regulator [Planctomycetota bacterium]